MDLDQRIKWDSSGAGEDATFRDSGISLQSVLQRLADGMPPEEVLGTFPALTKDDILAAIAFAAKAAQQYLTMPD